MNELSADNVRKAEPVAVEFEAAWTVFARTCGHFWAPEATFQAWFAHYLTSQFGIDRVAGEPIININGFPGSELKAKVGGGEVRPDAVVTRHPGIVMPHYANRIGRASDESGLGLLKELAVISELKVGATVQGGRSNKSLRRDVDKLLLLLEEYQATHDTELPLAYVCVLDNHARRQHSGDEIKDYCETVAAGRGRFPTLPAVVSRAIKHPFVVERLFGAPCERCVL
ncbi:hypothetical protein [Arthrobacter oryzae]|uniref:hypothetical protein n=1 Tax=Arthrobacter oryzae TaxID=409290 RepID=UPI00273BC949|nr:hypothetical protein [Arthrobacter oryzae]WLQ06108.1 hypothetical protein Q8Z05_18785 [Arthrobacter oryzae]